jgi:hypothetical protein
MNFRVRIPDSLTDKLKNQGESDAAILGFLQAVECDLTALERLNGYRAVAPIRFHTHRIVYQCPVSGERRKFMLWVDDCYSEEGTRTVLDFGEITSDEPYYGLTVARFKKTGRHIE